MPKQPTWPDKLAKRPARYRDLIEAGLTRHDIELFFRTPLRGVRTSYALPDDNPLVRVLAVRAAVPPDAVISGWAAAWLHGVTTLDGRDRLGVHLPVAVTLPPKRQIRKRDGLDVWRCAIEPSEITTYRDLFPITTPLRTCLDLLCRSTLDEAVVAYDAMLRAEAVDEKEVQADVDGRKGWRGIPQARRAVELGDACAESPQESRLRVGLVLNGLPRPEVNVELYGRNGRFLGRVDLLYREARIVIEYDGGHHLTRAQRTADERRARRLRDAGYLVLRYTADDLKNIAAIVAEVRRHLAQRGVRV